MACWTYSASWSGWLTWPFTLGPARPARSGHLDLLPYWALLPYRPYRTWALLGFTGLTAPAAYHGLLGVLGLTGRTASLGRLGLLAALAPCTQQQHWLVTAWLLGCADWLGTLTSAHSALLLPDSRAHRMGAALPPVGPWGPLARSPLTSGPTDRPDRDSMSARGFMVSLLARIPRCSLTHSFPLCDRRLTAPCSPGRSAQRRCCRCCRSIILVPQIERVDTALLLEALASRALRALGASTPRRSCVLAAASCAACAR